MEFTYPDYGYKVPARRKFFVCPEEVDPPDLKGNPARCGVNQGACYGLSTGINGVWQVDSNQAKPGGKVAMYLRYIQLKYPVRQQLFGCDVPCGRAGNEWEGYSPTWFGDTIGDYLVKAHHNETTPMSFADGHATVKTPKELLSMPRSEKLIMYTNP